MLWLALVDWHGSSEDSAEKAARMARVIEELGDVTLEEAHPLKGAEPDAMLVVRAEEDALAAWVERLKLRDIQVVVHGLEEEHWSGGKDGYWRIGLRAAP